MDIIGLLTNVVSGVIGGNAAGATWKDKSLGAVGNSIAGLVGGVAGGYILQAVNVLNTMGAGNLTLGNIAGHVGVGVVSGGILTAIVGAVKEAMNKKS
jgi:uncharacterized membrane protein YeaQ/YmgE (transglycosylase-associated protein family)